ncbi:UNVERIFIED_CONTAM: hypothetical protein Cloal_0688 [Acetivibrio alkalicellulosi]
MNKDKSIIDKFIKKYGKSISVPVELLVNPRYNNEGNRDRFSQSSAILYGVLLFLSKKENNKDINGYVTITNKEIANIIGTTTGETVRKKIEELERFDLIERAQFKLGQPYKLYVKEIIR